MHYLFYSPSVTGQNTLKHTISTMGNSVGYSLGGSTEKPGPKLLSASGTPGLFSLFLLFG